MVKNLDSFPRDISKIQIGILLISLISLIVSFNPQWHLWGLDSLQSFPVVLRIALLLLLALALVPRIQRSVGERLSEWRTTLASRTIAVYYLIITAILLALFVLLSSNNHLLGDGYSLLGNLASGESQASFESLTKLLTSVVFSFTNGGDSGALWTYRILAYGAGAVFLGSLWFYAESKAEVWIDLVVTLSFGTIQLFAGYAENYTLSFLFMFLYLRSALRDLDRQRLSPLTVAFLLVAIAFHLQGGVLLPSLIYLVYMRWHSRTVLVLSAGFSLVLLAGAVIYSMSIAKLELILVPLSPNSVTPYSLFCHEHLSDLLNLFLLNYPLALVILLTVSFWKMRFRTFHLLSILGTMLFTIMIDPKIGAIRDWDLLSVATAPLLVATLDMLHLPSSLHRQRVWCLFIPILLFAMMHTGSWIMRNFSAKNSYAYIKSVVQTDPHYSDLYDQGYRNIPWALTIMSLYADSSEGIRSLEVRVKAKPEEERIRYVLAALHQQYRHDPRTAARLMSGHWQQLLDTPVAITNLGSIFIQAGYLNEAEKMFEAFVASGGKDPQILSSLAIRKEVNGEFEPAWRYYKAWLDLQQKPPVDRRLSFYVFSLLHGHEQEGETGLREIAPLLPAPQQATVRSLLTAVSERNRPRIDSLCAILRGTK
jgi:hypothetical protein